MLWFRTSSWMAMYLIISLSAAGTTAVAQQSNAVGPEHPLTQTIQYVAARSAYIREHVHDYSCRLVKRERIDGDLQPLQFAEMNVRCEQRLSDGSVQPLSVFMHFLAPRSVKDRRVLFVANQNEGKVLVRKGGNLGKRVKIKVDPFSARARSESRKPITDIGLDKLLDGLVAQSQADIDRDPTAANTKVSYFQNVTVHNRTCTQIQIVHPQPAGGMEYFITSLDMDDQTHVPVRMVVYGWPEREGDEPPVIEEYNYVDMQINVGLTDADFNETLLDGAYQPRTARTSNLAR